MNTVDPYSSSWTSENSGWNATNCYHPNYYQYYQQNHNCTQFYPGQYSYDQWVKGKKDRDCSQDTNLVIDEDTTAKRCNSNGSCDSRRINVNHEKFDFENITSSSGVVHHQVDNGPKFGGKFSIFQTNSPINIFVTL